MKSEQVSVATKCLHFVMTERSLRTHFASILGFRPFLGSLGAAEVAVDFQEFPVGDAQQADRGAGLSNTRVCLGMFILLFLLTSFDACFNIYFVRKQYKEAPYYEP